MPKVRIMIIGVVQGVGFRWSAVERAKELGLTLEKAENNADGSVEFVVSGAEDSLQKFGAWARIGPAGSKVEKINTFIV